PSVDVRYLELVRATYEAFWHLDVTVDFVRPDADLSAYKVVAIPSLYLVSDDAAANLSRYVEAGGQLVCNFFSGIVDPTDAVRLGGYPGAFRQLLGVRVEEFYPLLEHQTVTLADGGTGRVWTELLTPAGAQVVTTYADGPLRGSPAITRREVGTGVAHYVTTFLDAPSTKRLLHGICDDAGVATRSTKNDVGAHSMSVDSIEAAGIETIRRRAEGASYLFVINHTDREVDVPAAGVELLSGTPATGSVHVAAGGVAVVRETSTAGAG
ncbi:MAG TPA: beta-galactosidase trimerization domain-containing protein, partial [Acidothermaceae bacterium]